MAQRPRLHIPVPADAASERDFSAPSGDDFDALSRDRIPVRSLVPADLPHIARIDRKLTGRDRTAYLKRRIDEALLDSAIRVSLMAELDGMPAGFVMARVDFGEFGHPEPVAVLDTIGVDPGFARRSVGHALLSQLLTNLAALKVERIETQVAPESQALLAFLHRMGFAPSQQLVFRQRVRG